MKFNKLNVPSHWQNYWTRFPEGHTILEALIQWVSQVDSMVANQNNLNTTVEQYGLRLDDFLDLFDTNLRNTAEETLKDWQNSGFLDIVINEALKTKYDEMDNRLTTQLVAERQRIDTFVSLQEGSTTGDAELIDTRIGKSGEIYNNAGNAVRGQVGDVASELENVFDVTRSKQLLNYGTLKQGYFFDEVNTSYSTSDFIRVTPGKRVYVYRYDNHDEIDVNAWGIETYNADKVKQGRIQLAEVKNYYDNENTSFIRVSGDLTYLGLIAVEEDEQTITSLTHYTQPTYKIKDSVKVANIQYNILDNKSLICCGDSITAGAGISDKTKVWGNLIAQRNNMTFTNAGISGSTMGVSVDGTDKNAFFNTNRHLAIKGHDYAIVWFGWNDYHFCNLGTVGSADTTTTLGALYATLNYIVRQSVETKVGVIIPYIWEYLEDEPQGYTIMSLLNGIKDTCELFGVPYLDINKYNFLQSWGSDYPNDKLYYGKWDARQKVFTSDTLHPNEKGNEYLSTIIENFIRSL